MVWTEQQPDPHNIRTQNTIGVTSPYVSEIAVMGQTGKDVQPGAAGVINPGFVNTDQSGIDGVDTHNVAASIGLVDAAGHAVNVPSGGDLLTPINPWTNPDIRAVSNLK